MTGHSTFPVPQGKVRQTNGDEEAESGEAHRGLYEQPLVVEGKRKRKSIEQFSVSNQPKRPKAKVTTCGVRTRPTHLVLLQSFFWVQTTEGFLQYLLYLLFTLSTVVPIISSYEIQAHLLQKLGPLKHMIYTCTCIVALVVQSTCTSIT